MKPLALVTTEVPLILVVFSVLLEEAEPAACGVRLAAPSELEPELAHAATISATATSAGGNSQPIRGRCRLCPGATARPRANCAARRTRSGQGVFLFITILFWMGSRATGARHRPL